MHKEFKSLYHRLNTTLDYYNYSLIEILTLCEDQIVKPVAKLVSMLQVLMKSQLFDHMDHQWDNMILLRI